MSRIAFVALAGLFFAGCGKGCTRPGDRADATAAAPKVPPKLLTATCAPRVLGADPGLTSAKDQCTKHAECKEREHGRCVRQALHEVTTFGQTRLIPAHNECVYDECLSDEECRRTSTYEPKDERVCDCMPERNVCSFANCRVDSDCPPPNSCGPWRYCRSAADGCRTASDCKKGEGCVYSWDAKHYLCEKTKPAIAPD